MVKEAGGVFLTSPVLTVLSGNHVNMCCVCVIRIFVKKSGKKSLVFLFGQNHNYQKEEV